MMMVTRKDGEALMINNEAKDLKKLNLFGVQVEGDQPAGAVGNNLRKQIFFGYT